MKEENIISWSEISKMWNDLLEAIEKLAKKESEKRKQKKEAGK